MKDCIGELKEKEIGTKGEEYYALLMAYISKINELSGKEKLENYDILRLAKAYEISGEERDKKALDKSLKALLKSQLAKVQEICLKQIEESEKIKALHELALECSMTQDASVTRLQSQQLSNAYGSIMHDKSIYTKTRDDYEAYAGIKYKPEVLEAFIAKKVGKVQTNLDVIKENVLACINSEEDKFFDYQKGFIERVVDLTVTDDSLIMHIEEQQSA